MPIPQALVSSKSMEWSTPSSLFEKLNEEFHFTLDPCCTSANAKCKKFYTQKEDGLQQDWSNETVFMNPPYCGQTGAWITKAYRESRQGATVVCLIQSATDRRYWHDYIFPYAVQVRFIRGRVKFGSAKYSAPFPSAIVVFDTSTTYSAKYISIERV